ncbi:pentapeptide repeat-containing protein [Candidatus Peregrinibacteria bacterium]|nr:pentapeptide repeat-containing protein [Candidatus Peregrinibacteria bacterium]
MKTSQELFIELTESESVEVVSGKFVFEDGEAMMDRDFVNKRFVNCELRGGDFASGSFRNCAFEKVLFKNLALVGVSFTSCSFIDCKLSNIQIDFDMSNCMINHLTITYEEF